jgi:hypothetical protein
MSDPREPGHPVGPEMDSTQNPTESAPNQPYAEMGGPGPDMAEPAGGHAESRQRDMLHQLQQMIDQLAVQAGPPMREIAAKAAELAALAAQRAGPLAAKAAEKTQVYGERFAARSKEVAAELRAPRTPAGVGASEGTPDDRSSSGDAG